MGDIRSFLKHGTDNIASSSSSIQPTIHTRDDHQQQQRQPTPKRKTNSSSSSETLPNTKQAKTTEQQQQPTTHKKKPGPKPRDTPILKLLLVKSEGETSGYVSKPEYYEHTKFVIATHREIRVHAENTSVHTVKQRGQIDAEIGDQEDALGCDELLAIVEASYVVSDIFLTECSSSTTTTTTSTTTDEKKMVVVAYKKKGMHGAYLLGKLAWNVINAKDKKLGEATKVGEPRNWLYSELYKDVANITDVQQRSKAVEQWYNNTHHSL
jgi:hypothetical protein